MIENKANINDKDNNGYTALIWASVNGHFKIVKLLIENKANINDKTNNGSTALIWASQYGYIETVKLLIENKANINDKTNHVYPSLVLSFIFALFSINNFTRSIFPYLQCSINDII